MTHPHEKSHEKSRLKLVAAIAAVTAGISLSPVVSAAVLEEVFVTAQKRVQNLQDVPVSVVAMSGDKLDDKGLINLEAVSALIPTLHVGESSIGEQLFIRGIGSGANTGFEQSVGIYIDGMYFGRGRQSKVAMFDVARVEVLKGPQGTLFGKNTIAGALNITSARPTDEFEGTVSAMYEFEHEETILTGIVSGPLTDSLRARLSLQSTEMEAGWITNDWRGGADEPQTESTIARLGMEWDASDDFMLTMKYTYSDFEMSGRNSELSDPNGTFPAGASMADLLVPYGEFGELDEVRIIGGTPGTIFNRDESENEMNIFMLNATWQLGNLELTSITGYTDYEMFDAQDQDQTPIDILAMEAEENYEQFSQEIRLTSPGGEALDYMVGAYYQYDELDTSQLINVNLLSIPSLPILSGRYAHMYQETTSWSVFAQLTWNVSDTFRTTLGLRYADDEKDVEQELRLTQIDDIDTLLSDSFPPESGVLPGSIQVLMWGGGLGTYEHIIEDNQSKDNFTPSINAQWDVSGTAMLYASVSTGYKGGGFDAYYGRGEGYFDSSPEGFHFDQEEVLAYEIGAKMSLLDGAAELNMAAFYNEFDDVQVGTFDGGLTLKVDNAAETIVKGFELEGRWAMNDNFTLRGAVAYLDAYYDSFENAQCSSGQSPPECTPDPVTGFPGQDLSGQSLQFAPETSGYLSIEHRMNIGSSLELNSVLDVTYSDSYWIAADLDPRSEQDSFSKVDLRVALSNAAGSWEIAFIGRNLTDENTSTWANDTPLADGGFYHHIDRLRSLAVQARYRF